MSSADERARARANWPGRIATVAEQGDDDNLSATTTPEERVAMVPLLTRQAWLASGRPLPEYTRADMPGRVVPCTT